MKIYHCPVCNGKVDLDDPEIVMLFGLHLYLVHKWTLQKTIALSDKLPKGDEKGEAVVRRNTTATGEKRKLIKGGKICP